MENKLDLILSKLDELNSMVTAVRHAQEITNAKLEALTMDVHKIQGDRRIVEGT